MGKVQKHNLFNPKRESNVHFRAANFNKVHAKSTEQISS